VIRVVEGLKVSDLPAALFQYFVDLVQRDPFIDHQNDQVVQQIADFVFRFQSAPLPSRLLNSRCIFC
jgi:hypothetical protein